LFEVADRVAWVTINRPEARNAVNQAVSEGLAEAWERVEADDDVAVAVLTGAGEAAFSAGADLKEMAARAERGLPSHFVGGRLADGGVTKPVIAAVNGVAFAFGFNLVMQCDLCVAADHSLLPGAGGALQRRSDRRRHSRAGVAARSGPLERGGRH
jgi:enoyl-CoA hydratase/carnithine racemase